jgi:hypothetical protein
MPVTRDQAELLAPLVAACRPHGATRWDIPGILAALAQVRDRSLPEVIRAATRLAENRDARTPMALGGNGPQWREAEDQPVRREPYDRGQTCGVCGRQQTACAANPYSDHAFEPVHTSAQRRLDPESAAAVISELRDRAQPLPDPGTETGDRE